MEKFIEKYDSELEMGGCFMFSLLIGVLVLIAIIGIPTYFIIQIIESIKS